MEYKELLKDFARRTKANLDFIEDHQGEGNVYEVTQLVNSLLGLVILPHEQFYHQIPNYSLEDLELKGWPVIEQIHGVPAMNLRDLLRNLRNASAHINLDFSALDNEINHINFSNRYQRELIWQASLKVDDLRMLIDKLYQLFMEL